jgi:hypothetical protein
MTLRKLTAAAALVVATGLALPAAAEAGHRHSRSCGHGYAYKHGRAYRPAPGYYGYGGYGYGGYGYGGYGYQRPYGYYRPHGYYGPYRYAQPYGYPIYPPPVPYYRYGSRPHVSLHLEF